MTVLRDQNAVLMNVPSPLVGEGYTVSRHELAWVRGTLSTIPMWRQPLTRLRFAKPPSPARGEGAGAAVRSDRTP
ncbi:hypothetical protein SAMN05216337_106239 [Bradyrhizobium brasilense]|uniref:Uncharacterized protein n=1 Tax=Bradyrhizobium brasilense TaxID=1419277 RepID=A0A1G7MCM0_9BRAD|nr:hypothetical protein SAMN05216337_106239 [Bradyrhizobium brasilense]